MWREIATTMDGEANRGVAFVGVAERKKNIAKRKCEKFIQFGKNLGHSRGSSLEAPKAQQRQLQRHPQATGLFLCSSAASAGAIVSLSFVGEPSSY